MNVRAAAAISAALSSFAGLANASDFELRVDDHLALDVSRLRLHLGREVVAASTVRIRIEPLTLGGAHAEVEVGHRVLDRDIDLADVKRDERERIIALAIGELLRAPASPEPHADVQPQKDTSTTNRRFDAETVADHGLAASVLLGVRTFPALATYALEPRIRFSFPVAPPLEVTLGAMTMHTWQADVLGDVSLHALTLSAAAHLTHRLSRTVSVWLGPRLDGGVAFANAAPRGGNLAAPTTAELFLLTAEAGASLDLSPRWRALVDLDAGSTIRGLELHADDRTSASFSGATAAAHVGVAFE